MGILTDPFTPPPGAYAAEPFTVREIDAHPDAARLWATVQAMRAEHEDVADELREQVRSWRGQ